MVVGLALCAMLGPAPRAISSLMPMVVFFCFLGRDAGIGLAMELAGVDAAPFTGGGGVKAHTCTRRRHVGWVMPLAALLFGWGVVWPVGGSWGHGVPPVSAGGYDGGLSLAAGMNAGVAFDVPPSGVLWPSLYVLVRAVVFCVAARSCLFWRVFLAAGPVSPFHVMLLSSRPSWIPAGMGV